MVLELERVLHNHRGVAVRMPVWNRQPQKCHFFELHCGLEIDPGATDNRNLTGIQVPDGHIAVIEKLTFSVEYWLAPDRARATIPNWQVRRTMSPGVPGEGAQGEPLVTAQGVIDSAGAVDLGVIGCCCDTSFRSGVNDYLYVYHGYPVYRTAERRRQGDIGWQPEHHRSGVWFNYPLVLWPGETWVIRVENAALDEEPRVSLAGIRGWVVPIADLAHMQEGLVTE